jgi:endonuclease YncB( thermonuclease family)
MVKIFWDPAGFEVDSLGTHEFLRLTDGDTPYVSMAVRMLSIDTPEVHYPGNTNPSNHDEDLRQLAAWIRDGMAPISQALGAHLEPKLADGNSGSRQKQHGNAATVELARITEERLTRPNGRKRSIFLRAANQPFDDYGRILAYIAPSYSDAELRTMSESDRATFNLLLVQSGWASSFPIYPSLPKYSDLKLLQEAAREAVENRRGAWADPLALAGYEFRMCVKLYQVTRQLVAGESLSARERGSWIERYCVDMTTQEIFAPQDYIRVPPWNRIFIWPRDVNEAVARLNLTPALDS